MREHHGKAILVRNRRAIIPMLAFALAGCQKPAPVAMAPPPMPVGHTYAVLVAVPPAPRYVKIKPADQEQLQQAFNVIGLKSALMVGALSCNQQDQYDAFMTDFQPHILAEQHVMDGYFRRIGGHYGQAKEDNFVTLLANNQSVSGIAQGSVFCPNNSAEFQQVMTLKTPQDLDNFVTDEPPADADNAASAPAIQAAPAVKKPTSAVKRPKSVHLADGTPQ